jgi:TatD DNase family protein
MRLVDTHAHIHDAEFQSDLDDVIGRARDAGVDTILTLGTDLTSSRRALALAERSPLVLAAAGVHPHNAAQASGPDLDELEAMAAHPRVALVGEIGLDFYRNHSPRDQQLRVLRRQLDTARRAGKPVAVHTREAQDAMLALLREYSDQMGGALPDGRPLGVMHYFSGGADLARTYVELGFVISIHTSVTHPRATVLADVARGIALEHLVLETDSPYGAPQAHRGQRNEPVYVSEAAKKVADLKDTQVEEVAAATTENALRLLGLGVEAARPR